MATVRDLRVIDDLRDLYAGQVALVLGNSTWRAGFPIDKWRCGPLIVCNFAYREFSRPAFVCASDPPTILEIVGDEAFEHTLITPTELGKKEFTERIERNGVHTMAVEGRFRTEPMSGAMAVGLAGWLGCGGAILIGFSCDGTAEKAGLEALRVGVSEMRRLSGSAHITVGVEPGWFGQVLEERQ